MTRIAGTMTPRQQIFHSFSAVENCYGLCGRPSVAGSFSTSWSLGPAPFPAFERPFCHTDLMFERILYLSCSKPSTMINQTRNDARVNVPLRPRNSPSFRLPNVQVSVSCILTTPDPKKVLTQVSTISISLGYITYRN